MDKFGRFGRISFSFLPEEARELCQLSSASGVSTSLFFRALLDASVDLITGFSQLSPREQGLVVGFCKRAQRLGAGPEGRVRLNVTLRADQLVRLGELAKALGFSKATVLRAAWLWWKGGFLDQWLPHLLKRKPIPLRLEQAAAALSDYIASERAE